MLLERKTVIRRELFDLERKIYTIASVSSMQSFAKALISPADGCNVGNPTDSVLDIFLMIIYFLQLNLVCCQGRG